MQKTEMSASIAATTDAENPTVGGAQMFADKTIVENAMISADHTMLGAAVQAASLVDALNSAGPFTVFAQTNAAFDMIDDTALAQLMEPQNNAQLASILACHVVGADAMPSAIGGMIDDDGGVHQVPAVGGCMLQVRYSGNEIASADVAQSNGVIHVIDHVPIPAS